MATDILGFLKSKLRKFNDSVNQNHSFQQAGNVISGRYFNPESNQGNNFWSSAVGQGLANTQRYFQSPQALTPFPTVKIKPTDNFGGQLGKSLLNIPSDIANTIVGKGVLAPSYDVGENIGRTIANRPLIPYNEARSGATRLGYQLSGTYQPTDNVDRLKQTLGNLAGIAEPIAIAYLPKGVQGLSGAAGAKKMLYDALVSGAKTGAKYGAGFGAITGLSDSRNVKNNAEYALKVIGNVVGGAGMGAGLGGVTGGVAGIIDNVIKAKLPGIPEGQVRLIRNKYLIDEAGRFRGSVKQKKEPIFYGDLRESLGMPREGLTAKDIPLGLSVKELSKAEHEAQQKLLTGATTPLTPKQAKQIFKKTGEAYPFQETLGPKEDIKLFPPGAQIVDQKSKPMTENQGYAEWEKALSDQYNLTPAFKKGKIVQTTQGFPAQALSDKNVKDKGAFGYQRETLLRNLEETFGQKAPEVKKYFHDPIVANETSNINWKNKLKTQLGETFKKLNIRKGSREDMATGDYIEGTLPLEQLKQKFPKSWQNIVSAANTGRAVYKDTLTKINKELNKFGYDPIPERENYVTHTAQIQTLLDQFGNMLNFSKDKLPTTMSGINVETKPGRQFFSFGLQRKGGSTHEGLITALEKYIEPAGNQIFHTADIQRGRALQNYLEKSSSGTQDARLSNFNSYLKQYVDSLSGKQNIIDRPVEKVFGRSLLKAGNWIAKRTGANMVGGNISSALTNFIPFTQALATTDKPSFLKGMFKATLSPVEGLNKVDGVQSSFLTRRFPVEGIQNNLGQKIQKSANVMFKLVDGFTSKSVVAGKYFENLSKGMAPQEAMKVADEYAARILADRSFGQVPLLFNSKMLKAFTQFQIEVNNQMSFLAKDIPKNLGYKPAQVISALSQVALYSYVFNSLFEKVTGRRPALDPIHAATNAYEKILAGAPLKDIIDPTDQNTPVGELASNIPFTSAITGGRIPIGGAIPDVIGLAKGETTLGKELLKPATYLLPPTGGGQIKKSLEGIDTFAKGFSETPSGNVRFPVNQTAPNLARTTLFGQYATPEARDYFKSGTKPLSDKQSTLFKQGNSVDTYNTIQQNRQNNTEVEAAKTKLRSSGGKETMVGNTFLYLSPKTGNVESIDLDFKLPTLKLTGDKVYDKKLVSKYNGVITAQQNDLITLADLGKITQQEAINKINQLEGQRSKAGSKPKKLKIPKVAKPKKVAVRKFKLSKVKVKLAKIKKVKSKTFKLAKVSPKTFKLKKY